MKVRASNSISIYGISNSTSNNSSNSSNNNNSNSSSRESRERKESREGRESKLTSLYFYRISLLLLNNLPIRLLLQPLLIQPPSQPSTLLLLLPK